MSRMFQRTARAGAKALRPQCDLRDREEGGAEQARRPGTAGTVPHGAGGGGVLARCTLGAALGARDGRVLGCGWSLGRGEALPPRGRKQDANPGPALPDSGCPCRRERDRLRPSRGRRCDAGSPGPIWAPV